MAVASTARKKVTIGINARRPFPWSSKNCPISKTEEQRRWKKKVFKPQGGCGSKGRPHPYTISRSQPGTAPGTRGPHPVDNASAGGSPYKYWNEDALSRWLGPENLGWAILDGVRTRMLVDNGARVNSVMPAYVRQHGLGVCPISELDHSLNPFRDRIPLVGLGSGCVEPMLASL